MRLMPMGISLGLCCRIWVLCGRCDLLSHGRLCLYCWDHGYFGSGETGACENCFTVSHLIRVAIVSVRLYLGIYPLNINMYTYISIHMRTHVEMHTYRHVYIGIYFGLSRFWQTATPVYSCLFVSYDCYDRHCPPCYCAQCSWGARVWPSDCCRAIAGVPVLALPVLRCRCRDYDVACV